MNHDANSDSDSDNLKESCDEMPPICDVEVIDTLTKFDMEKGCENTPKAHQYNTLNQLNEYKSELSESPRQKL